MDAAELRARQVPLGEVAVSATGFFDIRGTLGVDRDAPVGVQDVVVTIDVGDMDSATADRLSRMTERYCVVGQSLATAPHIVVRSRA